MNINIEHTTDFRELAKLNETVQTWHHKNYPEDFKPFDVHQIEIAFEKMLQDENVFGFIARHNNNPIGYLIGIVKTRPDSAFQYEKTVLYIDQVAVIKEYQKNGVGQLLVDKALKLSELKKVKEVQMDYWTGNKRAESFFLKNGFRNFNRIMRKQ